MLIEFTLDVAIGGGGGGGANMVFICEKYVLPYWCALVTLIPDNEVVECWIVRYLTWPSKLLNNTKTLYQVNPNNTDNITSGLLLTIPVLDLYCPDVYWICVNPQLF